MYCSIWHIEAWSEIREMALAIKKNSSFRDFEVILGHPSVKTPLILPTSLKHNGALGLDLAYVQFLLSWVRSGNTTFTLSRQTPPRAVDFVGRASGLALAYLADQIFCAGDDTNLRDRFLTAASERVGNMYQGRLELTAKGPCIELAFIQPARQEFHNALYSGTPKDLKDWKTHGELVRNRRECAALVSKCFDFFGVRSLHLRYHREKITKLLGVILHEVFRNTAEHAYLNPDGGFYAKNIRCVKFTRFSLPRNVLGNTLFSSELNQERSEEYFNYITGLRGEYERENVQFFELSIFDSGGGLARTLRRRYKYDSDLNAVAKCFEQNISSKEDHENSGEGLFRLLDAVSSLEGFLRIRTSTVEGFYAPISGLSPKSTTSEYLTSGLPEVEGSLFSIVVPIIF